MDESELTPASPMTDRPPPIGSLVRELGRVMGPVNTAVQVGTTAVVLVVVVFVLPPAAQQVGVRVGHPAGVLLFGVVTAILLILDAVCVAFLPPLLLSGDDRTATAVQSWIGARSARRALGRPSRAVAAIGTPEAAAKWLAETPSTDELRQVRFDGLLILGRFDEARSEAELMPDRTPIEAYQRLEAHALVDEHTGLPFDEQRLRGAIARIPPGLERAEASASLAVALARRALPDGDWRAPLVEVRPMIPESDFVLLTRDFGATIFELLARRVFLPILLLVLGTAIVLSVAPLLF
jgi:hypothetical protein